MIGRRTMNDLDREKLLGYLMNALEADEIARIERELLRQPRLRSELAELQEELSPLTYVYESVDPPKDLAKRTCKRVWDLIDKEERVGDFLSAPTVPDRIVSLSIPADSISADVSPEEPQEMPPMTSPRLVNKASEINPMRTLDTPPRSLPHVELLEELKSVSGVAGTEDSAVRPASSPATSQTTGSRLVRRVPTSAGKRSISSQKSAFPSVSSAPLPNDSLTVSPQQKKHKRLADILISISIGILIAIIAFPAVNFAKNQAQSIVTQNKINEISQSAGVFAAHLPKEDQDTNPVEEPKGINLAQSGWQEVVPNQVPLLNVGSNSRIDISPSLSSQHRLPNHFSNQILPSAPASLSNTSAAQNNNGLFLGQSPEQLEQVEIDPKSMAYQTLISSVGQTVSLDGASQQIPSVQTAFGQNVLFQNGRVFFRILPVFEPNETASLQQPE